MPDDAEALNQLNGPNQASIDLINKVRDLAFNNDPTKHISLATYTDKTSLDLYILKEQGWETYFEGFRRDDLLRHGQFLQAATARSAIDVWAKRELFPIPQSEINANKNLAQNPGY